jgi:isoleucyl-tRNA synthetase
MEVAMRAVDLVRTLRARAGLRTRQPIATLWLALPGAEMVEQDALLALVAAEVNVKSIELIGDESDLVDRRVKVLLPKVGKRLGARIPEVMAAAREGRFELMPDGSVELAGVTLAADEVEIQASPKPGTAVAHDHGLVAVIDTKLTPELVAEGDARELQRAIQDLRREAGLALDDRVDLWIVPVPNEVVRHLPAIAGETLARIVDGEPPPDVADRATVELEQGPVQVALRRQPVGG